MRIASLARCTFFFLLGSLAIACSSSGLDRAQSEEEQYCVENPGDLACLPLCSPNSCSNCACSDDEQCKEGVGCVGTKEVGEECAADWDCASANCSELAELCRVDVGAPCTEDNCDRCLKHEDGWSYCSRDCSVLGDRGCNGDHCLGTTDWRAPDAGLVTCRPPCETDCPTQCSAIGGGGQFCDCEPDEPGCELLNNRRIMGEPCRSDIECESGDCYNAVLCSVDRSSACSGELGRCTDVCSGDSDCIESHRCVGIHCDENGVTGCSEQKCLPLCNPMGGCAEPSFVLSLLNRASCVLRRPTEGPDVMVCDVYP